MLINTNPVQSLVKQLQQNKANLIKIKNKNKNNLKNQDITHIFRTKQITQTPAFSCCRFQIEFTEIERNYYTYLN